MSLSKKRKFTIKATISFFIVATFAVAVYAHHYGISQYVVIRGGNTHGTKIYNPTNRTLFGVGIFYNTDESLSFCEGFLLTPHGHTALSDAGNSGPGGGVGNIGDLSYLDIITGTSGSSTTVLNHKLGVVASAGKGRVGAPLDTTIFNIENSSNGDDVRDCICDRLGDFGESQSLFRGMGVKCSS